MAFNKVGTPSNTISLLREDGKVVHFCHSCSAMTEDPTMDKKAFADGKSATLRCDKCGNPLS